MLQQLLPLMAGDESTGNLLTDSSGFSKREFEEWHNAKYGDISVRKFCKLHIIHTLHGKICAATVTGGARKRLPPAEGDGAVPAAGKGVPDS